MLCAICLGLSHAISLRRRWALARNTFFRDKVKAPEHYGRPGLFVGLIARAFGWQKGEGI